uniref:TetR family transcriptional regulator n=1 Tax=Thermogemmatispora argillosa TaxID=2045280 RepID=A0A455T5Z9_9CHLR|nr:TetR family transcriptional regulator [Thermogemmatispora argillosa]
MAANRGNREARKAELLRISREVFAEKGFEATTISEIVARAGVAQGTFYWYFPSKASVLTTLAREMQERIETALRRAYDEAHSLQEMIERSVAETFQIMSEYRDILAIVHFNTCWTEHPAERQHIFAPYYGLIAEIIRQEQQRGTLSPTINPEVTAILIVGTVYYAAEECYIYNSPVSPEVFIAECSSFIRHALGIA